MLLLAQGLVRLRNLLAYEESNQVAEAMELVGLTGRVVRDLD